MRAEYLAGALAGRGVKYDEVGRSTKPHDELAAYLGRVSRQAMDYAMVVYFGEATERNIYRVYLNVLLEVSKNWEPIGEKPKTKEAILRWQKKNGGLVEKLTRMAIAELMDASITGKNKGKWRAEQLGISEQQWFRTYRSRYDRISGILNDWDGEFRGKVYVNQRELAESTG